MIFILDAQRKTMEKIEGEYTVIHFSDYGGYTVTLGPYTQTFYADAIIYMKNGKVHRDGGQPAIINNSTYIYARDGLYYREADQPAYESPSLNMWYDVNGLLHRDADLPAVVGIIEKRWYSHGKVHRETRDENGYLLYAIKSLFPGSQYCLNGKFVDCVGNLLYEEAEEEEAEEEETEEEETEAEEEETEEEETEAEETETEEEEETEEVSRYATWYGIRK